MAMPDWWVGWTGAAFIVSLVMNLVMIIATALIVSKVLPLITKVQKQVDDISGKVESVTTNVKNTVDTIHARTTQILGSAEEASAEVTRKVSAASAAISAIFIVTRLVGAVRGMSQSASHTDGRRGRNGSPRPTRVKVIKS